LTASRSNILGSSDFFLNIGGRPYNTFLNGIIDEVRIFTRVLPESEIGTVLDAPEGTFTDEYSYYSFATDNGNVLRDVTGHGHNGSLYLWWTNSTFGKDFPQNGVFENQCVLPVKTTGQATTGQATNGQGTSSQATSSQATSSQATNGQGTSSQATSSQGTSSQATNGQGTSGQATGQGTASTTIVRQTSGGSGTFFAMKLFLHFYFFFYFVIMNYFFLI